MADLRPKKYSLRWLQARGFGLLELMVVLVVASLLASLGIPAYQRQVDRARVAAAIGDMSTFELQIERFRLRNNDRIPGSLAELGIDIPIDPWEQPYRFLNIVTAGKGKGALRKDGKLNPLNTDYDLYSIGKDGDSMGPLSAEASRDDIVRANNGAFIGLGKDY